MGDSEDEGEPKYEVVFDDEPDKVYNYLPLKEGKAVAKYLNGDSYVGEYKDGMKHGKGVYKFKNGSYYDGDYVKNKREGLGLFVAPDKGKYTGDWLNDKRHGEGTYVYPNGDAYTGEWKNGAKHGPGMYTYANIDSKVNGSWSNGRCVDGQYQMHDASQYIGGFLSNQPAGEGLYVFPSGQFGYGRYANQTFTVNTFKPPHPTAPNPEIRKPDLFKRACRGVDKAVGFCDHYNDMHFLKAKWPGVPNFRLVRTVAGCGQPTAEGFKQVLESVTESGFDKTTWINLRDDPVAYVNGTPYSCRDKKKPDDAVAYPFLDTTQLRELEGRLCENFKFGTTKKGQLHDFLEAVFEADTQTTRIGTRSIEVKSLDDVLSISKLYEKLAEEDCAMDYKRVPIRDSPSIQDFDKLAKAVREVEGGGIIFNDALGGSKTSAAMIIGLLVRGIDKEAAEEEDAEAEPAGEDEDGAPRRPKKKIDSYDETQPDYEKGEYAAVMKLVTLLNGPDPEEKRRQERELAAEKKAAEAVKKAEEDARKKQEDEEEELRRKVEAEATEPTIVEEGEEEEEKEAGDEGDEDNGEDAEAEAEQAPGETAEEAEGEAVAEAEEVEGEAPLPWIKYGTIAKATVDAVVDASSAMGNLRKTVWELKDKGDRAGAVDRLGRYCNFILFAAYLKDVKDNNLKDDAPAPPKEKKDGEEDEEGNGEESAEQVLPFSRWCEKNSEKIGDYVNPEVVLKSFHWS